MEQPKLESVTATKRLSIGMTVDDLYALPDDHPRCELMNGELWMKSGACEVQRYVSIKLKTTLTSFWLGATGVQVEFEYPPETDSPSGDWCPDILIFNEQYPPKKGRWNEFVSVPYLWVKVIYPVTVTPDQRHAFARVKEGEAPHYWIADTRSRSIEAWSLVDGVYELVSEATAPASFAAPPFAELVIDLEEIFPLPQGN